jgi:uncharacterized protein YcnI
LLRRGVAALVLTAGLVAAALFAAGPAWAHVTVSAPGAVVGGTDAVITLQVPDESASASTVGLKVRLPTDHPIAGVLVQPMPGWTTKIVRTKLANPIHTDEGDISEVVSEIDWTADAASGIKPGYFGQFSIIGGKLPDGVDTLFFKAIQTYSDNTVVSWIDEAAPGSSAELEHPAPELRLAAAGSDSQPAGSSSSGVHSSSSGKATAGVVLGVIGILLGGAALALALLRRASRDGPG